MHKAIFLPKWTELVVAIYNTPEAHRYCGRLYRKTGMTVRHIRNLIGDLEDMNIIERQEMGKIKYISLTETGERLAELFLRIYPEMKR